MIKKNIWLKVFMLSVAVMLSGLTASVKGSATLYTPYTRLAVSPGTSIDYTIDLVNHSGQMSNDEISIVGMPDNWKYNLVSGAYSPRRISVLNGEKKTMTLKVDVPYQVEKNTYTFYVRAGSSSLQLVVDVTETGSNETEFSTTQANMQGSANSTFSYRAALKNRTAQKQLYSLRSDAPRGWSVTFQVDGRSVTSVEMEANTNKDVQIELKPSAQIVAGSYKIPLSAVTGSISAKLELEAVVTGSHELGLRTENDVLSTTANKGGKRTLKLVVRNTGASELRNIEIKATPPAHWEVNFEPTQIDQLAPGSEATVTATVKVSNRAVLGDYQVNVEARTPEAYAKITVRTSVEAPFYYILLGIVIIAAALYIVVFLFRKFGRR
ncbi:MAG: hypothetical protein LBR06_10090 [Bacteroidales bacterium]|jgi:uncharacterized membrane protein|nr:hypothetical protein [Bacteroidales bacterium]